jgi:hypothetical protein
MKIKMIYIFSLLLSAWFILTGCPPNLSFDVDTFIQNVSVERFNNTRTFAPIRVSFHGESMAGKEYEILNKINKLELNGFRVGLYCVECDSNKKAIKFFNQVAGLDFQIKPLLDNKIKYNDIPLQRICRTNELLLGPDGRVFRCCRDMYKGTGEVGWFDTYDFPYIFRSCDYGNECHPCDLKVKRDRFGNYGYQSVELRTPFFNL